MWRTSTLSLTSTIGASEEDVARVKMSTAMSRRASCRASSMT